MLEIDGVSYEADGRVVLRGVGLGVGRGEFVAVTGVNGSGKSVLLKIIMGILEPNEGRAILNGESLLGKTVDARARMGVGLAFQQPVRFRGLCVRELLEMAAGENLTTDEACEYLSRVGLCAAEYLDREFDVKMSGGEAKRIEIAMLLARDAKLFMFDEPEAGIDLWGFADLTKCFEGLRKEGRTILVVSHQERILQMADRVLVLEGGKLRELAKGERVGDCGACAKLGGAR